MDRLWRLLSSTGLTVGLCLLLAAVGAAGSFLYFGNTAFADRGRFNIFQTPLFLAPVCLLIVNVVCCAATRLSRGPAAAPGIWPFAGLHAGLILVMGGMVVDGAFQFVGTGYFFRGVPSSAYHDWRSRRDAKFPFLVEVTDVRVAHHPLSLQVGVKDGQGNRRGLYTVREGVPFRIAGTGITVVPRRFETGTRTLLFDARVDGRALSGMRAGPDGSDPLAGYVVVPVAFGNPEPSDYSARIAFTGVDGARVEREARMNSPAVYSGISFCIVDQGTDNYGNRYLGLQMTREPGQPFFWCGALLFSACLLLHLRAKARRGRAAATGAMRSGSAAGSAALVGAALLLAALPGAAGAAGRAIAADETWGGVVRVDGPVSVEKGATLRVRPGTRVLLSGEDRDGDGCPDGGIRVFGTLLVEGEKARPVIFAPLDAGKPWEEIFMSDARGSIRNAVFEGARWGLHIHGGDVRVERALFRGNDGGARVRGTGAQFARCTFRGNGIGLRFWDGGPRVTASVIEGNGTGLFYRDGAGGGRISGNRIANREWDLKIGDWATGDLDASGNYWGNGEAGGAPRGFVDYREGGRGTILLAPALAAAPADCGSGLEDAP